jgi:hypothetical protein
LRDNVEVGPHAMCENFDHLELRGRSVRSEMTRWSAGPYGVEIVARDQIGHKPRELTARTTGPFKCCITGDYSMAGLAYNPLPERRGAVRGWPDDGKAQVDHVVRANLAESLRDTVDLVGADGRSFFGWLRPRAKYGVC